MLQLSGHICGMKIVPYKYGRDRQDVLLSEKTEKVSVITVRETEKEQERRMRRRDGETETPLLSDPRLSLARQPRSDVVATSLDPIPM